MAAGSAAGGDAPGLAGSAALLCLSAGLHEVPGTHSRPARAGEGHGHAQP